MKKAIAIFLVLTFCSMLLAGCSDAPADGSIVGGTSILNIGTGSVGGTDNTVVEAISSVVNQKTGLKTSTITTNGGTEIIYLLETGDIQAGYSGTIDLINALNGASSFDHAVDPSHMLQCFGFVTWDLPLVVLDNSGIENYEDLAGKRVGLSPVGSSTAEVLMLVLEAYDLTDSVTIENFTWNEGHGIEGRPYRRHGGFLGQRRSHQRADRAQSHQRYSYSEYERRGSAGGGAGQCGCEQRCAH